MSSPTRCAARCARRPFRGPAFKLPTRIGPGQAATSRLSRRSSPAGPPPPCRSTRTAGRSLLALVALATTLLRERAGIALALAVPVFPLGNISLGLALLYCGARRRLAARDLARAARDAALRARPAARADRRARPPAPRCRTRALGAAAACSPSRSACSRRRSPPGSGTLPCRWSAGRHRSGSAWPARATRSTSPARSPARPARTRPSCSRPARSPSSRSPSRTRRARGRWAAAGLGAGMIVLTVAVVPSAAALPLLLAAWAIAAVTALRAPALGVPSAAA